MFIDKPFTYDELLDRNLLSEIITEGIKTIIPNKSKLFFSSEENRYGLLQEHENAFLIPNNTKYPLVSPTTKNYDCSLIYASRLRLRQQKLMGENINVELIKKADSISEDCGCNKTFKISVEGHKDKYDLIDLIDQLFI